MAVDPAEFERVRELVGSALARAFEGAFVAPLESDPGKWLLWPDRMVKASIQETRTWNYGTPGPGTGRLHLLLEAPHGGKDRFHPRPSGTPIGERLAAQFAGTARIASDAWEVRRGLHRPTARAAYKLGYEAVRDVMTEDERAMGARRHDEGERTHNWSAFQDWLNWAVSKARGHNVYSWREIDRSKVAGDDYARFGAHTAFDDWQAGLFTAPGSFPPGTKEWRPPE